VFERAKKGEYNLLLAHLNLAMTYAMFDQEEKARDHMEELLKEDPNFTLKRFPETLVYKNQADADRTLNALRKAGLSE
jgi:Tfp pilus assembly protein PilF